MLRWVKKIGRAVFSANGPVDLGEVTEGGPWDSALTLLVVCGDGFDIKKPNAAVTARLGYCRGFAKLGIRYRLVHVNGLVQELEHTENAVVFLSAYDFNYLGSKARRLLKDTLHFIWVPPSGGSITDIYRSYGIPSTAIDAGLVRKVLESGAAFLWGNVPPSGLEFYQEWEVGGNRVMSLPLACDDDLYYPRETKSRFDGLDMAFVGGYWKRKAFQIDKYLRPYEDRLTVFGYSEWPYSGYRGMIAAEDEPYLYRQALVSPTICEPHAELTGDIVERGFKVLGSGGLTITDAVPHYRELFSEDELLVPKDLMQFHEFVRDALNDEAFNRHFRENGYRAIIERHTYMHRAKTILEMLDLQARVPC
jgi:hypothetical protein